MSEKKINMISTIRIWFMANFSDRKLWRVMYDNDTKRTIPLHRREALERADFYEGRAIIDYTLEI